MDFFKQMAEQLRELEEQQRLAQLGQSAAGSQGSSPKNQQQAKDQRPQRKAQKGKGRAEPTARRAPLPGSQTDNECVQSERNIRGANQVARVNPARESSTLLEDLSDRLGEAVLMQEILGPPRSLKAWE